ncbi:hypothetical protein ACR6C2_37890 [Streptomyces sp. INA 01156]
MTTTATGAGRPVITAWSAVSPFGIGRTAFAEGVRERRSTVSMLDEAEPAGPRGDACVVPGFEVRTVLGKRAPGPWTGSPDWRSPPSGHCSTTPNGAGPSAPARAPHWLWAPPPAAPRA